MVLSLTTFAGVVAVAVGGILLMAFRLQSETTRFIEDLQFFLKHRTISDNQSKARMAVYKTKCEKLEADKLSTANNIQKLEQENQKLKSQITEILSQMAQFEAEANDKDEKLRAQQKQEIDQLELEITSIQKSLNNDIRLQLANYLKEVDGLKQRITKARTEITTERASS